MEPEQKLAEFFRNECDYTSLLEEVIAAQTQMLNVHERISKLPDNEQPATNYITDLFFTLEALLRRIKPENP